MIKTAIYSLKFKDAVFYFVLIMTTLYYSYVIFSSANTFDYGDGIQHFLMSKYSWKHPEIILDLWGKPLFTIVSSPFSQFGLKGIAFFQLLCAILVSVFSYKILETFRVQERWLLPVFIFFSPIYFAVLNSGLTEILFSLTLVLTIYFFIQQRFVWGAIIFSFALFVRPESYFMMPLIVLYLLIKKQFRYIPLLATGFVFFSLIGYFYYKDIFWIIHNNYQIEQNYPQKGELWHYLKNYKNIWGRLHFILLCLSILYLIFDFIVSYLKNKRGSDYTEEKFLMIGSIFVVFILHTLMNALPGLHSNLGMQRFFASIIPFSAMLSLNGLGLLILYLKNLFKNKIFHLLKILIILLVFYQFIQAPYCSTHYPFQLSHEQSVVNYASEYLKKTIPIKNKKICYLHPQFAVALNIDPFDNQSTQLLWSFDKNNIASYPDSTIILWDSHFSPVEGHLPLSVLLNDKNIFHLKTFKYIDSSTPFEIWIFLKISDIRQTNNKAPLIDYIGKFGQLNALKKDSLLHNFDKSVSSYTSSEVSESPPHALHFSTNEWGDVFSKSFMLEQKMQVVDVEFYYYPNEELNEVLLIIHIQNEKNEDLYWWGEKIKTNHIKQWNKFQLLKSIDLKDSKQNYRVNVYFWNKSKNTFYIDDMKIYYYLK